MFDRLRADLDRAHAGTLPFTADRARVNTAREQVEQCQRALATGDYDRRQFDDTIAAIQRVVDLNRLADRTHDNLLDDVRELRALAYRLTG